MLKNEEITSLISAIGIDIGIDVGTSSVGEMEIVDKKIRYGKIIIMSVDAEEHVFVRDGNGVRMTKIGPFIDAVLAEKAPGEDRLKGADFGEVLCFGLGDHEGGFRPIEAVIRHPLDEERSEVKEACGRARCVASRP